MKMRTLPRSEGDHFLKDYDDAKRTFHWEDAEKYFTWYKTGKVNIAYEAVDRHAEGERKNKVALIYRDGERNEKYTFNEMKNWSNRAGNVLNNFGVKKGDLIVFFMPRVPELYFSILGAIKVGAIVVPLFEAFMEDAVYDRIHDSGAKFLVTTKNLLKRVPEEKLPNLETIFIVDDLGVEQTSKYVDFKKQIQAAREERSITWVEREDGLILHYTSGSTGKPKGVLHVHNAMLQYYMTAKWVLDLKDKDTYWCTANPGWVTGTAYGIFAPWLLGSTNVVIGDRFSPENWYKTIEEFGVTVWYSAPTSFRMLMGAGDEVVSEYDLTSLRHILSVGEPLSPEVIRWGLKVFGQRIHDTWWMTETGAQMICNYPSMDIRPGSMGKPIPGVEAAILDEQGNVLPPNQVGNLALKTGWPAMMRQIWNNPAKYDSYFLPNGWFITGDSAYMDQDGYFWYQGRLDDVIMTSGERVGPFEIESKLMEHPAVREAGVIGKPDLLRGEIIKAFIVLKEGYTESEELREEIRLFVRNGLAANLAPHEIEFLDKLPKTRSGKIMRRVLKTRVMNSIADDLSDKSS